MSKHVEWQEVTFEQMTAFAAGKAYKSSKINLIINRRNGRKIGSDRWLGYGPTSEYEGHSVEFEDGTAIAVASYPSFQLSEDTWSPGSTSFWVRQ